MKRFFSLLLSGLALLAGCSAQAPAGTTQTVPATTEAPAFVRPTGKEALQGKKILFLGNSYTFFGQTVNHKGYTVLTQEERSHDQGFFYQLCKANGIDVEVTNFTFGSHHISDIIGYGPCQAERDCDGYTHQDFLTDPYFDYVSMQCYTEKYYRGDLIAHLQPVMDFFREHNPNVQFLFLVPQMAHERNYPWLKQIEKLKEEGILICDWGGMLHDISQGAAEVPGATLDFNRNSFVNNKDNHHENPLAGYITTLMAYCAITGESPVGQPYDFCDDPNAHKSFGLEKHRKSNYLTEADTNFVEIFASPADMQGLQELTAQYLKNYTEE